jgi:hypothetical protein
MTKTAESAVVSYALSCEEWFVSLQFTVAALGDVKSIRLPEKVRIAIRTVTIRAVDFIGRVHRGYTGTSCN